MLLAQPAQPVVPVIVQVVAEPTKEITVADVLMGSVGIIGVLLIGAAVLGFGLGGVLILFRRWQAAHGPDDGASQAFQLTQPPRPQRTDPPA